MEYAAPKGVFDILPFSDKEGEIWRLSSNWSYLEKVLRKIAKSYHLKEIRTPIIEKTALFLRGVGEDSDIVNKEIYTFNDKGGRSLSLRPEGTAPVMRSFIEKNLHMGPSPQKLFYIGPMFRYERPQAGRYRQHHQFGVEIIGDDAPERDVEAIDLLCQIYSTLGIKNVKILLNSVGGASSRNAFKKALKEYLTPHFDALSTDSKGRFTTNPLRILDSKDPADQKIIANAPSLKEFLSDEEKSHIDRVAALLDKLGWDYKLDQKLVRGLDYYNNTVFEVVSTDLGAQNSLGGGGRYDGLIGKLGGKDLPAVGFATGMERILQVMLEQKAHFPKKEAPFVTLISLGKLPMERSFTLATALRHKGIPVEFLSTNKVQNGLKKAVSFESTYCIIIGEEELQKEELVLKNLATRESQSFPLSETISFLENLWTKE